MGWNKEPEDPTKYPKYRIDALGVKHATVLDNEPHDELHLQVRLYHHEKFGDPGFELQQAGARYPLSQQVEYQFRNGPEDMESLQAEQFAKLAYDAAMMLFKHRRESEHTPHTRTYKVPVVGM